MPKVDVHWPRWGLVQNLYMLQYNIYYDTQYYMVRTSTIDTEDEKDLLWKHTQWPYTP